jgi:PAS domain-containing protein
MVDLVIIESAVRDDGGRIVDFQIDYMNQVQIDVAGRPRDELIGRRLSEVYPATMESELFEQYVRVVETGEPLLIDELPYEDVIDGQEVTGSYTLQATRFDDGIIVASRDISDAVAARHELRIAYEQLAAAQRLAQMGIWRIDLATQSLTFSDELYRLFELPTGEPIPDVPESIVSLIHPRDRDVVRDLLERTPHTGEPFAIEITIRRPSGDGIVLATGSVAYDEQGNPRELWGTAQDVTQQRRSERLLQSTTARLEQEHATVLMLQEAFAPELPVISWAEVAGRYLAAGPDTQVGGDWYDVVCEDDHAYLMVGDVAGHGIRAVASMAQLRNAMRACAVQGLEPSQCLALANRLLTTTDHTQFATAVVARIDRSRGEVIWSSAGHPPLLLRGPSGTSYLEAKQGPPLGVIENGPYLEQTYALEPGDTLIAYTDGLVEQRKVPIDVRLAELSGIVDEVAGDDVGTLCRTVCNRMFVARERRDDVCIVAFRPTTKPGVEGPIGTSSAGPLR